MNAHTFRSILRRRNLVPLTAFFLFSLVAVCGFVAGTARSSANGNAGVGSNSQFPQSIPGPTGEDMEKEFNDDDLKVKEQKPRGKWTFATLLDTRQYKDSSIPVILSGVQSLSVGGKYAGVTKIKRVEIKNRSPKTVNSVQLRWTVASVEDPTKVLSEGTTQFVNTVVEANNLRVVEIPTVHPALLLKPLAKDGELYGQFELTFGMQEVRFADGSFWRRQGPVAYLNFLYPDRLFADRFPVLTSVGPSLVPPLVSSGTTPRCSAEPRLIASAFSFTPVQTTTTCFPDSGPSEDEEGRRSCGKPAPDLSCYATCTSGYCNTWTRLGPCDPSTATPTPTPTPRPAPNFLTAPRGRRISRSSGVWPHASKGFSLHGLRQAH